MTSSGRLLIDTQVISRAFKLGDHDLHETVRGSTISSITANEFLLAQGQAGAKPDYFILPQKRYWMYQHASSPMRHAFKSTPKHFGRFHGQTDQMIRKRSGITGFPSEFLARRLKLA